MFTPSKVAFLVSALLAGAGFTHTASALTVVHQPMSRSAIESPRVNVADLLARRGADDRGVRGGEGAGHPAIEVTDQLARRGADNKGADDRGGHGGRGGEGAGHPAIEVSDQLNLV